MSGNPPDEPAQVAGFAAAATTRFDDLLDLSF